MIKTLSICMIQMVSYRSEIPIIGYRSHRMLMQNQMLYMSVSTHRMAAINHLGRIEHIYNLGNYIVHHDY